MTVIIEGAHKLRVNSLQQFVSTSTELFGLTRTTPASNVVRRLTMVLATAPVIFFKLYFMIIFTSALRHPFWFYSLKISMHFSSHAPSI